MPEVALFVIGCTVTAFVVWGLVEVGKLERRRLSFERKANRRTRRTRPRPIQLTPSRVA